MRVTNEFIRMKIRIKIRNRSIHEEGEIAMKSPIDKYELEKLLSDLISIYSPYLKEDSAMKFVFDWFKERDIPTELHTYTEDKILKYKGLNAIGSLKGSRKGPVILLNGHVDTVEKT